MEKEKTWENFTLSEYFEEHLKSGYPEIYHTLCCHRAYFSSYDKMIIDVSILLEKAKERNKEAGGNPLVPLFRNEQEVEAHRDYLIFQKSMKVNYQKLFDALQEIRINVEVGGNPLKGRCKACPNIIIKEEHAT